MQRNFSEERIRSGLGANGWLGIQLSSYHWDEGMLEPDLPTIAIDRARHIALTYSSPNILQVWDEAKAKASRSTTHSYCR